MEAPRWFNYSKFYDFIVETYNFETFVEVGVWRGDSVGYLASKLKDKNTTAKIYAVDLFDDWVAIGEGYPSNLNSDIIPNIYNTYNNTLNGLGVRDMITDVRSISWEAADKFEDGSLDIVYIDADHEYDSVYKDVKNWYPKVKKGGIISGHDAHAEQVMRAVNEQINNVNVRPDWGWVWYKVKDD